MGKFQTVWMVLVNENFIRTAGATRERIRSVVTTVTEARSIGEFRNLFFILQYSLHGNNFLSEFLVSMNPGHFQ